MKILASKIFKANNNDVVGIVNNAKADKIDKIFSKSKKSKNIKFEIFIKILKL